ncbi:ATP-binding cassette, subfamily B, multidrug efflux pump [Cytobacillus horneckiae]|uniref:ABC transporter ATP-binding protein n=1 Tax=Cytobacillus horneckiae TaxID=549687 RepID=A0A2N0ZGJ0_9BACI|nr:ABC transporter ATP-binding protein [Cytobacillus horneckiae]MBN6888282.1 ABC transporter ATP-binding protein [Cytobacillus horneckiae]MCM3177138.1 ABC transporter ATP-binding protein/permease [Cytobacillus horneckiae]MEC1154837.1 ABC transporter ATP-binding protein [Cytobacillus horneckiae]MED2940331.1 ABC transporter ATP-binding protein [Cytobacillus horneckiae]PKG28631.1 ABC transporter ATP-binding protein [Cytobacillus horneckiae]
MLKVLSFLKPYRLAAALALVLMLTELSVELLQPLLIGRIIDEGIMKNDFNVVLMWGGAMVGVSAIAFASGVLNSYYAAHVGQSLGFDIRKSLMTKIQSFSFGNFNRFPTSSLITRMTNDVTQVQNTIFMSLRIMLRAPLLVVGSLVMSFFVNWQLAIIFLAVVPILVVFLVYVMKKGGVLFKRVQEKLDHVNNVMQENLVGIRLIKAFNRRNHEVNRFSKVSGTLKDGTVKALRLMEVAMPVLLLVMNLCIMVILWFGRNQINLGEVQVGEVVAIINYATRMTTAFSMFSFIIMALSRARASSERIVEVLDASIDLTDQDQSFNNIHMEGEIEFNHVSFKYPDTEEYVLKDLHFTVQAGETVAVLGATGSGKSSLFQLIPRLYDAADGKVLIDHIDVKTLKMDWLRKNIGFAPQEAMLFSGSIKDNISWGKENAAMEDVIAAAKNAQIHETIMALPQQYETKLGQKGVNLSGGQKQRLSVARALIRKPKILLLDDSTSALDMNTEAKLLQALKTYTSTTMIITQKISTAKSADRILLLEDGLLIAEGTHEQLLFSSPLYREIAKSQLEAEVSHLAFQTK